ncbi:MAG: mechanosensitive ion channel family protein [Gammaproteobacteria bacterium]|nr:mechanosensitive ion channel family protein [Gammaproteobacteria bacterium]
MDFKQIWNDSLRWLLSGGDWVLQVFVVTFLALLLNFFVKRVLNRLKCKLEKTKNPWDDSFVDALQKPVSALIWIMGIAFAAEIVQAQTKAIIFDAIAPIRDVGVIVVLTWFLIRFAKRVEQNIVDHSQRSDKAVDVSTVDAIAKLIRVSIIITASLVVLQTMGYSISGVLAFGGIGGIAIGFAAKDLLANFFGGLMIYLDRPFKVGDWIRSPDRDIEGTVETIGWRLTCIRTFDKRPLYIPNATFASIAVENPSRMSHRRIYETIGIRYDDAAKMPGIITKVKAMLSNHKEIDASQTMIVNLNKFAPSSLDFFVYTFTRTTNWIKFHEVKQDVLLKILSIIENEGAECAFPTSTMLIPDEVRIAMDK